MYQFDTADTYFPGRDTRGMGYFDFWSRAFGRAVRRVFAQWRPVRLVVSAALWGIAFLLLWGVLGGEGEQLSEEWRWAQATVIAFGLALIVQIVFEVVVREPRLIEEEGEDAQQALIKENIELRSQLAELTAPSNMRPITLAKAVMRKIWRDGRDMEHRIQTISYVPEEACRSWLNNAVEFTRRWGSRMDSGLGGRSWIQLPGFRDGQRTQHHH